MNNEIPSFSSSEKALEKIAIKMLKQGLDGLLIKQVTALSSDELAKLKSKL